MKGPFRAQEGGTSYRSDVLNSGLRVVTTQTKIEQAQYAQPSTETMYKVVCRGKLRKPNVVDLGHGAKGLWIGREDAEHVMLYIHGTNIDSGIPFKLTGSRWWVCHKRDTRSYHISIRPSEEIVQRGSFFCCSFSCVYSRTGCDVPWAAHTSCNGSSISLGETEEKAFVGMLPSQPLNLSCC